MCALDTALLFQSTPSTRRETRQRGGLHPKKIHFNPLPPHGGRRVSELPVKPVQIAFQSTPSTRRETRFLFAIILLTKYFNPLPPHGGRLCVNPSPVQEVTISIHSLHTEGDLRGNRHKFQHLPFQSTPSTRRETDAACVVGLNKYISIHSLHTEGDFQYAHGKYTQTVFQSTPSTRRETSGILTMTIPDCNFNPHPPHGGRRPERRMTALC